MTHRLSVSRGKCLVVTRNAGSIPSFEEDTLPVRFSAKGQKD